MTYRLPDKPPRRRRHLVDVATPSVVCVDNGTISRIEIPCDYVHMACHDRMLHDHLGWPEPRRRDRSCQLAAGEDKVIMVNEMNLPDEGYTDVEVAFVDAPTGLVASGLIDHDVIWLTFEPLCEAASTEDVDVQFAAYATGLGMDNDGNMTVPLRDVIAKGTLHIVAGPIPEQEA